LAVLLAVVFAAFVSSVLFQPDALYCRIFNFVLGVVAYVAFRICFGS